MTERLARFSITYDGDPDGDRDLVINAGSGRGFTVTGVLVKWQPEDMSGSSDVPYLSLTRFSSAASGGTAATVFNHVDGDTAAASGLIDPTSVGSNPIGGPQYWPGTASYTGSVWYLHGDQYFADLGAYEIQVDPNASLRLRAGKMTSTTVFFYENLV